MEQLVRQIDPAGSRWRFEGFISESSGDIGRSLGRSQVAGDDEWLIDNPKALVLNGENRWHAEQILAEIGAVV
jgi:hypothetical protein